MQIVVDANPIVSILITPGKPAELLFKEELELVAPNLLFQELKNNMEIIAQKSGLNNEEIKRFIEILKNRIKVIPEEEFVSFKEKAMKVCPDEKDLVYFALALSLKCPLWSNEKKLKEQGVVSVYATHQLMRIFNLA